MSALGSIVGTAGSVAAKWSTGQQLGMWGKGSLAGAGGEGDPLQWWKYSQDGSEQP